MSIEQEVLVRHKFEDVVKKFLDLASLLTDRELEISLGRLVDTLNTQLTTERTHTQIKGEILKLYYDLRKQGVRKQRKVARWWYTNPSTEIIELVVDFQLLQNNQFEPPSGPTNTSASEMVHRLTA